MISEMIRRTIFLSSAGTTCQGASLVLVAAKHFSYASLYSSHCIHSEMSASLSFQFFSASSMRARKRLRYSSFGTWMKDLMVPRLPLLPR